MKKNMIILALVFVATSLFAQGYTSAPTYEWKSVSSNQTATAGDPSSHYTIGTSTYSSTIYAVGAESPTAKGAGPHKAGIGDPGQSGTGGNEPVITPIGDGLWVLLTLAAAYAVFVCVRRRKAE
ncbi:MAG: hypothetical protein MJZ58_00255 [Paludibacteraceae bacterium]|nr:hypothetical protein [Paludibacteraceae bacterium]